MSLKKNIVANYISQIYTTAVGILILPLYIKYMGVEAYGLIGFFIMLQAWFSLLDMGLTPTISRETARYRGGSMSALAYRQLFRALNLIFISTALLGGGGLWWFSDIVATRWLQVENLEVNEVIFSVQVMAASVALRWLGGLYRGVVTGSERLVWLSGFNITIATLRFVAVFYSMHLFGFTPKVFFIHQFVTALLEVAFLWGASYKLIPEKKKFKQPVGWSIKPVRPVLKFAISIAFSSSIWVLVAQTDKLVLSGILPLEDYGYFTLAVLASGGIIMLSAPISMVIMPRMAKLHAEGNSQEMIRLYRTLTKVISVVAGSAAIVIAFSAEPLLYAWIGDRDIAVSAAPVLTLYALGNGMLAISAFPYYLQYALGDFRYHLLGSAMIVAFLVPTIIVSAMLYGAVGAGWVWLSVNTLYFIVWVGYSHRKLCPDLHLRWLLRDIVFFLIPIVLLVFCFTEFYQLDGTRIHILVSLFTISILSLALGGLLYRLSRRHAWSQAE